AAIVARTVTTGTTPGAATAESGPPAGTVLWKTDVGAADDPVRTAPAVEQGRVFAGSIDGNVYALDSTTGTVLWKADMGRELVRAPVVHAGTVFAAAFNRIGAFDAATGQRRWPDLVSGTFLGVGSQPPAVYATSDSFDGVVALDPVTGRARWTALTQHSAFSKDEVATGPDVIAIILDSTLYVLDPVTGAERWRAAADSADRAALAGSVVVLLGAYDGLATRKLDSGAPLWTAPRTTQSTYAAAAEGILYVGAESGKLYALDSANGDVRWLARTEAAVAGPVAIRGDTLYGVWGDGVHALDARTGASHWNATVGRAKSAVRLADRALFGYADQHVYAVAI
ncbi:outer membrane protein assembly factor BamB family protein, partial [Nocardia barduliensis]|uniref:outer membrane protein assembly factor BamB family protein n=1 Tax=Nocardia barduliensis TaxID=2736643 RepID=UPI001C2D24D1